MCYKQGLRKMASSQKFSWGSYLTHCIPHMFVCNVGAIDLYILLDRSELDKVEVSIFADEQTTEYINQYLSRFGMNLETVHKRNWYIHNGVLMPWVYLMVNGNSITVGHSSPSDYPTLVEGDKDVDITEKVLGSRVSEDTLWVQDWIRYDDILVWRDAILHEITLACSVYNLRYQLRFLQDIRKQLLQIKQRLQENLAIYKYRFGLWKLSNLPSDYLAPLIRGDIGDLDGIRHLFHAKILLLDIFLDKTKRIINGIKKHLRLSEEAIACELKKVANELSSVRNYLENNIIYDEVNNILWMPIQKTGATTGLAKAIYLCANPGLKDMLDDSATKITKKQYRKAFEHWKALKYGILNVNHESVERTLRKMQGGDPDVRLTKEDLENKWIVNLISKLELMCNKTTLSFNNKRR